MAKKSIDEDTNLLLHALKKKTLSQATLKRILLMRNLKNSAINGDAQELQNPQWLLRCKLTLFGFLVMVCDKVDDWDKFSKKNLGLGRLHFHAISHLKVSPALARDHKLFLLAWYIYRGCLINFKLLQFCSYYYSFLLTILLMFFI